MLGPIGPLLFQIVLFLGIRSIISNRGLLKRRIIFMKVPRECEEGHQKLLVVITSWISNIFVQSFIYNLMMFWKILNIVFFSSLSLQTQFFQAAKHQSKI